MSLNIIENNMNTIYAYNKVYEPNSIWRYNGSYEPIFIDIPLFNNTYLYNSNGVLKYWKSNYKFDVSYQNFGIVEEIMYSKVNPIVSPLKLKDTDKDKSIYPMVDEYGYGYCTRFIFNSSWDRDFYIITNTEQNVNKMVFSNLTSIEHIIDPIKTKN